MRRANGYREFSGRTVVAAGRLFHVDENAVTCEICASKESIPLWDKGRWGHDVPNVICKDCGLVYVHPQGDGKVYRDELPTTETGRDVAQVWERILDIRCPVKILDVGCGVRGIGAYFAEGGDHVVAIDPDPDAILTSRDRWPRVHHYCQPFENFTCRKKFDFILFIHSLEHFRSPKAALAKAGSLLKPSGRIGIEVPCVERPYDWPEWPEFDGKGLNFFLQESHLYTFSLKSLSSLLNLTGFRGVRYEFDRFLRCVAVKSIPNGDIEREDAESIKKALLDWHRSD